MIHYNVAQADISVYSDRIVFTEEGGKTYKILVNDLPDYIVYDYDNYIPADATIEAVLDYKDVQGVPKNYYRVIAQIISLFSVEKVFIYQMLFALMVGYMQNEKMLFQHLNLIL